MFGPKSSLRTALASVILVAFIATCAAAKDDRQPAAAQESPAVLPSVPTQAPKPQSPAIEQANKPITAEPPSERPDPRTGQKKSAAKKDKEQEHEPLDPDTGTSTLTQDTLGLLPNPWTEKGVKFALTYVSDTLGNLNGGIRRQLTYQGRFNGVVDVDLAKILGWQGLSFHANVFQIHGRGLSRTDIGNLMPVSSIEALATTRLYEAWFEQAFGNDRRFALRAGQLAADAEFFTTRYSDPFINASYGWPAILAINLPSGAPSPPLSSVGARFKAVLSDSITVLSAIFNGDPAGPGTDDPQSRNRYGVNFRVNDPPLFLEELQVAWNQEKRVGALPGTFKLGGWYHAGPFNDQRLASNGVSQADPEAALTPAQRPSDYGVYGVLEQMLTRFSGDNDARGIGAFLRVSTTPGDRNLIDLYADGGISIIGIWDARPHDKIGLGWGYSRISGRARELDRDFNTFGPTNRPVRDYEALLSLSYLAEIKTGWTVLPTFQYVINPGGGYVFDNGVPKVVANTAVIGVRTIMKF